jgi:hypothetical protein
MTEWLHERGDHEHVSSKTSPNTACIVAMSWYQRVRTNWTKYSPRGACPHSQQLNTTEIDTHQYWLTPFMSPPVISHPWNVLITYAKRDILYTGDRTTFVPPGSDIKEVWMYVITRSWTLFSPRVQSMLWISTLVKFHHKFQEFEILARASSPLI